ncbi:hypothetical protein HDV04_000320 [Boothiomyces sp. JEL0838]|nr:hypothetical protein HDV04_000320 [Boothiomyces sp. JEL0838]
MESESKVYERKRLIAKFGILFTAKALFSLYKKKFAPIDALVFASTLTGFSILSKSKNKLIVGLSSLLLNLLSIPVRETINSLVFVRAIHYLYRSVVYKRKLAIKSSKKDDLLVLRKNNKITRFIDNYGEFMVWIYISMHINYALFLYPHYMPHSFVKSIYYTSGHLIKLGKEYGKVMQGMTSLALSHCDNEKLDIFRVNGNTLDFMKKNKEIIPAYDALVSAVPPRIHHDYLLCAYFHPHYSSCFVASLSQGYLVFKTIAKTYFILNLPGVAIKISKQFKKKQSDYWNTLKKFVFSSIRSTLMVSTYIGSIELFICLLRRFFQKEHRLSYAFAAAFATPAIWLDKPGRLLELNTYCTSVCVKSYVKILRDMGYWNQWIESIIMMPVYAILVDCIRKEYPAVGLMKPVFKWFFE